MNTFLDHILTTYRHKQATGLVEADRQELQAGCTALQERLRDPQELDALTVHQGTDLYFYLADRQGIVDLCRRYLNQSLCVEEKAWAWWEMIDNLCLLEQSEQAVISHQLYLAWAKTQWEQGHLPSNKLLLTIADETWAQCWLALGKIERWFEHFNILVALVEPTTANRLERFYCLRTACAMWRTCANEEKMLASIAQIRALAQEDTQWERSWEMEVQALDMEARVFLERQDKDTLRRIGLHLVALLEARSAVPLSPEQATRLAIQYDNVAATMFLADLYDLSIPLHRRCLQLSHVSEYAHLALAAALWATTKEREAVLHLLREGVLRCRGDWFAADFQELAEFEDVREDKEFEAVVRTGG